MTVFLSQQEAGLAVASLLSLGVLCVMCLSCRKKPRIIREENVIYGQQLVRGGRRFTVLRSKTVRLTATPGDLPPTPRESRICATAAAADDQPNYQNIHKSHLNEFDNMYVNPIPNLVYQNVTKPGPNKDEDSYSYENVFPTLQNAVNEDSESSDYANTSFLEEMKQEEEPDYVNTEENNT
ncbi:linker for activation of T-cells family member 2 [Anguilla anguilla]|nr:linker for activation of T-cells family member 2 [Anguilla anguilla]